MPRISLGDLSVDAPADYSVKMVIMAAPQKPQVAGPAKRFMQAERPFLRNIVIGRETVPDGTPIQTYVDRQIEIMSQQMPGFRRVKQETLTIDGVQCPLVEGQGTGPEGMLLGTLTAYVPGKGVVFTLSASHLAGLPFQETRAEYVKMFESFQIAQAG